MITNKDNLPQPLVDAVGNIRKPTLGEIGVTTLIGSPRPRMLRYRHFKELSEDVSDRIWALLGTAVHYVLEKADTSNHLSEEFLDIDVDGMKIKGVPDLLSPECVLTDWKVTSVWSLILGTKDDWIKQLNIYAYMYRIHGFDVKKLQVVAMLRDWQKSKAKFDPEYPQSAVVTIDIPLWSVQETHSYIKERVKLHQEAEKGNLPECTPEERWEKPTKYAVYKGSNKRATRVLDSEKEAEEYAINVENARIEVRPGEQTKCNSYCNVAEHCSWYQDYLRE